MPRNSRLLTLSTAMDVLLPICTDCGGPMRMSRIQLHRYKQIPNSEFDDKFGGVDGVER